MWSPRLGSAHLAHPWTGLVTLGATSEHEKVNAASRDPRARTMAKIAGGSVTVWQEMTTSDEAGDNSADTLARSTF